MNGDVVVNRISQLSETKGLEEIKEQIKEEYDSILV